MPQCHPKFFTSSLNWGWAHRVPGRAEKKADACSLYFCLCKLYTYKAVGVLMCGKRRELKGLRRSWPIWEGCLCFLNYELFQQQNYFLSLQLYATPATLLVQFSPVQLLSRVQICDLLDCRTPGLPVFHHLPELTQTHVL